MPKLDWENMRFQPYFTATSANVAFGIWSHDISGPGNDMELYLRWMQWGAFSPIMRQHERGDSAGDCAKRVFPVPQGGSPDDECFQWAPFDAPYQIEDYLRAALQGRAQLLPYIYSEMFRFYATGVAFVRPLYYEWPQEAMSYEALTFNGSMAEYMFGDAMFVAPIVTPRDAETSLVTDKRVWVPPGLWIDDSSGTWLDGPSWYNKDWDISEVPVFVREGAIVAKRPLDFVRAHTIGSAQRDFSRLELNIYPGDNDEASAAVYEDDGLTTAYLDGQYSFLNVSYVRNSKSVNVTVSVPPKSAYPQQPAQREIAVRLKYHLPPNSVSYSYNNNGSDITVVVKHAFLDGDANTWWYDGKDTSVVLLLPPLAQTHFPLEINFYGRFMANREFLSGLSGAIRHAEMAMYNLDETKSTPGCRDLGNTSLINAATYGQQLEMRVEDFYDFIQTVAYFPTLYNMGYETLTQIPLEG